MVKTSTFLAAAVFAACALPDSASGHQELTHRVLSTDQRKLFVQNTRRALEECNQSSTSRKLQERVVARRTEAIANLRQQRRQRRLDATTVLAIDHKSSTEVTKDTASSKLFDSDTAAVVEPELTEGPYYVSGELIRDDMRDSQEGVDMYIHVQVIDVSNCDPVKNMRDPTDEDGVAEMLSIFPGHYAGRTTHMHFIGNYGGTVLSNKTYSGASVSHVGQFFFDQDLITSVEKVMPYSTNTQTTTLNKNDNIFTEAAATGYDPIMTYALLGETMDEGLFVWISVAVDMTAERDVKAVSALATSAAATSTSSTTSSGSGSAASTSGSATSATTTTTNAASSMCKFGGFVALVAAFAPVILELAARL
ncbi:hypothetical protein PR003_g6935 [Phytophthora rubi]|uniref:Intradiol ring-cleavage dioxygenases domain-containing protein n=1 Tax=Phytophthora rubi TaxID=129364 RepID=A0A6A3N1Q2_9STRA|nr:hypothetical protein PR002_g6239 [Phytophthora rubi]KAE9041376.1 hypothetical protein PR001_g6638 [Phytophthora rubi]KAE9347433.1 hypothetical protein PR003_g6935 [Phytophthora rubi]